MIKDILYVYEIIKIPLQSITWPAVRAIWITSETEVVAACSMFNN